jgi:hypothetical protein
MAGSPARTVAAASARFVRRRGDRYRSHLLESEVEVIAEYQHQTHFDRKTAQSSPQVCGDLSTIGPRHSLIGQVADFTDGPLSVAATLATFVRDDCQKPGPQFRTLTKACHGPPGFQRRILNRVFGVVGVLKHPESEPLGDWKNRQQPVDKRRPVDRFGGHQRNRHSTRVLCASEPDRSGREPTPTERRRSADFAT